jgi:hypothetical protein
VSFDRSLTSENLVFVVSDRTQLPRERRPLTRAPDYLSSLPKTSATQGATTSGTYLNSPRTLPCD